MEIYNIRDHKMASATQNVLQTPELFVHILLQLDQRSLLTTAQRVNQHWHQTVKHTPIIQEALFFKSRGASTKAARRQQEKHAPQFPGVFNPVLVELFPDWFIGNTNGAPTGSTAIAKVSRESFGRLRLGKLKSYERRREAFLRPGASWRRMLVQQPPIYKVGVLRHTSQLGGPIVSFMPRHCKTGFRMGALYDIVHSELGANQGRCSLYWLAGASEDDGGREAGAGTAAAEAVATAELRSNMDYELHDERLNPQLVEKLEKWISERKCLVVWSHRLRGCVKGYVNPEDVAFRHKYHYPEWETYFNREVARNHARASLLRERQQRGQNRITRSKTAFQKRIQAQAEAEAAKGSQYA